MIDYFDTMNEGHNLFAPIINVECVNLLSQALILSKSAEYKSETVGLENLILIYHSWLDIIGYREKYIIAVGDKGVGANRQMLTMASTQMRYQSYSIMMRAARAYGFFVAIPLQYDKVLREKDKSYVDLPNIFVHKFGIELVDFLSAGLFLQSIYLTLLENFFPEA